MASDCSRTGLCLSRSSSSARHASQPRAVTQSAPDNAARWLAKSSWTSTALAAAAASIAKLGGHSHSQNGEDVALHAQFFADDVNPGTFAEMGAFDGDQLSNTHAFERLLQWKGVLIEANPALCAPLVRNRPSARTLCTAVSANYSRIRFEKGSFSSTFGEVAEMDSFHRRFHRYPGRFKQDWVPSGPLGHLLRMVGLTHLDLFSLDVEGSEIKVLLTHDWSLPVRVWCIEVAEERRAPISALMASKGYRHERWLVNGNYSFEGSELWVWDRGPWTPEAYTWRQYGGPDSNRDRRDRR